MHKTMKCCMCRSVIDKKQIKNDTDLIDWLEKSEKLGIIFPSEYVQIPKQIHQSLRKISFHSIYRFEIDLLNQKIVQTQRQIEKIIIEQNRRNEMLNEKIYLKQIQLEKVEFNVRRLQKFSNKIRKSIEFLKFPSSIDFLQCGFEEMAQMNQVRIQVELLYFQIEHLSQKLRTVYQEKVRSKCSQQHKQMLLQQKTIQDQLYSFSDNKQPQQFFMCEPFVNNECKQCNKLLFSIIDETEKIQLRRKQALQQLHGLLRQKCRVFVRGLVSFFPNQVYQFMLQNKKTLEKIISKERKKILFQDKYGGRN